MRLNLERKQGWMYLSIPKMLCLGESRYAKLIVKGTIYQGVKEDVNGAKWFSNEVTNDTLRKTDDHVALYKNR